VKQNSGDSDFSQPGQKVHKTSSHQKELDLVTCTCHLSYTGNIKWEDHGPNWPGQKHKTLPQKITKPKKG
jgi:hypothetical protein